VSAELPDRKRSSVASVATSRAASGAPASFDE
jgi:hypothetical protein